MKKNNKVTKNLYFMILILFFANLIDIKVSCANPLAVPYIRQCGDTPDDFDGRWACGATSAVMITAHYGKLPPDPILCTDCQPDHNSDYGKYVSDPYTLYGYTFDISHPTATGTGQGAYGHIHYYKDGDPGYAWAYRTVDYFRRHGLFARFDDTPTEIEVKSQIDKGHPVWASTGTWPSGHIVAIKGYTTSEYYIADPWPSGQNYCYDGSNMVYTWADMGTGSRFIVTTDPISPGDRVSVLYNDVYVREEPRLSASDYGFVGPRGTYGTILYDGSYGQCFHNADGYTWWKIQWDNGKTGWSACGQPWSITNWIEKAVTPAYGNIIIVDCNGPSDYNSIQEGIDHSRNGDTVLVHPGIYYENINFYGRAITVAGTDPNDIGIVRSTIIDANGVGNVVTFDHLEDNYSVLLGLTVRNGIDGIYCDSQSNPLIRKCVVSSNNQFGIQGNSASPTVFESIIEKNNHSGISSCNGLISKSIVSGNTSYGIVGCDNVTLRNCVISGNGYDGIRYDHSNFFSHIINCVIFDNKGNGIFDGIYRPRVLVSNSIISKNAGRGLLCGYYDRCYISSNYNNVWNNRAGDYSSVSPGANDISVNPFFAFDGYWDGGDNWINGDYHLLSRTGRWDPIAGSWVIDAFDSPCLYAGDPNAPIGLEPFPNGGVINQGAYGGTVEASKSAGPMCPRRPDMDFNNDCKVDFKDFALFSHGWLECNLVPKESCWE